MTQVNISTISYIIIRSIHDGTYFIHAKIVVTITFLPEPAKLEKENFLRERIGH